MTLRERREARSALLARRRLEHTVIRAERASDPAVGWLQAIADSGMEPFDEFSAQLTGAVRRWYGSLPLDERCADLANDLEAAGHLDLAGTVRAALARLKGGA